MIATDQANYGDLQALVEPMLTGTTQTKKGGLNQNFWISGQETEVTKRQEFLKGSICNNLK